MPSNSQSEHRNHAALLGGCVSPPPWLAHLHDQTSWSIDKRLAYGIWFAAIAAGYAAASSSDGFPDTGQLAAVCCVVALIYPAAIGWQSAWERYHAWPNAKAFISDLKPIEARSQGHIYLPAMSPISLSITPRGGDWMRWSAALSLNPTGPQRS